MSVCTCVHMYMCLCVMREYVCVSVCAICCYGSTGSGTSSKFPFNISHTHVCTFCSGLGIWYELDEFTTQ